MPVSTEETKSRTTALADNYSALLGSAARSSEVSPGSGFDVTISASVYHLKFTETNSVYLSLLRHPPVNDLLEFSGIWKSDDFEERLQEVYSSRSKIELD